MCGIAGYVSVRGEPGSESVIARMADAIRHRGPDGSGFYRDAHAALGHRRLSVIDLALGHQPMANEDGTLWIVYNGEIFNHASLRPPLEAAGHRYRTHCDTETIIHAFEQHGPASVNLFRGMFAFALWDKPRRALFCARDRLGVKPFYYYWDGQLFAFASEIKALLEHPSISPRFEDSLLSEYLAFGYVSGEQTLFRGIRKLMPGHWLRLEIGPEPQPPRLEIVQYWDVPAFAPAEPREQASWIQECRGRLEETVRMRLMSDVPLGVFLSGGVDSSAIAALMKRITAGPVKTFAVGYAEEKFSELPFARRVARHIGAEHHEVRIGMAEFFNTLPGLVWHEDEPVSWPSSVSLYYLARLASEQVKVVLTGEGGDELFGGYARYAATLRNQTWMRWLGLVPRALRHGLRKRIAASPVLSAGLRRKIQHTPLGRGDSLQSLFLDNFYCAFSASDQRSLLRKPEHAESAYRSYLERWEQRPGSSPLARMLFADQKTYLVELLMKQDQMSMAASIESRVPFLDHPFVEFAAQVPDSLKIRRGEAKYILKEAVADLLPAGIVRRRKMGFPTPLRQWLHASCASGLFTLLRDPDGFLAAYANLDAVGQLIARHQQGVEDATDRIWRLLNLQLWGEIFVLGKHGRNKPLERAPLVAAV
ncbi:MAG TPA: asparagine synthase (glutamine-hydrolyzing) [Bryobacteraceae bacterium]|nr:asparagine synthase (glutamine-hydrolyzing) [Bryobacteraceae bacterium]